MLQLIFSWDRLEISWRCRNNSVSSTKRYLFLDSCLTIWKELQLHQNSSIMKLTLLFLLFFCIVVNCINTNENSEDYDLSSRLSLKDRKLDWQRINSGQTKVLKKRRKGRKVLKRRPSSSENKAKSTFIRPFNRDSRCKLITVCLKITEKVAFNIASEASYVCLHSGWTKVN